MAWSNWAMNAAPEPLPNDVAALHAMLIEVRAERDAERAEKAQLAAACDQLASQNDRLRHLIRQLQRLRFGRRSEKLDPDQLNLALEDVEQAIAETEAEQEKADPALRRARAGLPVVHCPSICRGSRSLSSPRILPAGVAAARCR